MLRFAAIAVGDGHAQGCARCATPTAAHYRPKDAVRDDIRAAVAGWTQPPGPNVRLCGPEPLGHPELPALVAECVDAGVARICVETDGAALSVGDNAPGILHAGVRQLWVRVLAGDEAVADALVARPGHARAAREGVQAYRDAAASESLTVAVTAVVPVCTHNIDALPATVAECARWGVDAVRLIAEDDLPERASALAVAACDTGMVNHLWVEAEGFALPESHALHLAPEVEPRG